ncbi:hypothetical protein AB3M83_03470 [Microbacterium sp. 179-B 1A2 NHS]|uniref:hypothetical protein n=1 Tax=Microbacterium sp. 179-B 1A2 NHS TaxID=3142383 RepID=UPI0039A2C851
MKRIDIRYGDASYSVGGEELEDLQSEIARGLTGEVVWLRVNDGEGVRRDAYLLISPGVAISLIPVADPDGEGGATPRASSAHSDGEHRS